VRFRKRCLPLESADSDSPRKVVANIRGQFRVRTATSAIDVPMLASTGVLLAEITKRLESAGIDGMFAARQGRCRCR
jgi:hypothetical protein